MLTPEYLAASMDDIVSLYERYQTSLIDDMARRMAQTGVSDASVWQMRMYQEAGGVYSDAMKRLAELTGTSDKALAKLFYEAGAMVVDIPKEYVPLKDGTMAALSLSPSMRQALGAGLIKTRGNVNNLTLTTAVTSQQAYIQAASLASLQVQSGGMSYQQAIANAIRGIADDGLSVLYPSGHRDKLDVAVRRAVLTGVNQTCAKVSEMNTQALGAEYVETTAHMGARPDHEPWQGRVFHVGGAVDGYGDFETETGYGTGAGLCGWNCRHTFFPFFPGLSERAYADDQLKVLREAKVRYNGKDVPVYEATQMQRGMEREIRKTKRELSAFSAGMDATSDPKLKTELRGQYELSSAKLKWQRETLKGFVQQTGLPMQGDRTQVKGFGRSAAGKAAWAAKPATATKQQLIGLKTSDGIQIEGVADHFYERLKERNLTLETVSDALQKPLEVGKIRLDALGRPSQNYVGEKATVALNPDEARLVTVHPTHAKLADKLRKRREQHD